MDKKDEKGKTLIEGAIKTATQAAASTLNQNSDETITQTFSYFTSVAMGFEGGRGKERKYKKEQKAIEKSGGSGLKYSNVHIEGLTKRAKYRASAYASVDSINADDNAGIVALNRSVSTADRFLTHRKRNQIEKGIKKNKRVFVLDRQHTKRAIAKAKTVIKNLGKTSMVFGGSLLVLLIVIGMFIGLASLANPAVLLGTYPSDMEEITESTSLMDTLCDALINEIEEIESSPEWEDIADFDYLPDYNTMLDRITYDPYILQAYLNAQFPEYRAVDVEAEIESIFNELFQLEYEVDDDILYITMTYRDLEELCLERLGDDEELLELFELYSDSEALEANHFVMNPFDIDWRPHRSSPYGRRFIEGKWDDHTGMDIALDFGTPIKAGVTGEVVTVVHNTGVGYGNRVDIQSKDGTVRVLYAHMSAIYVSEGDIVIGGKTPVGAIGETGWATGPHLHIEVYWKEKRLNPLFVLSYSVGKKEESAEESP